MPGDSPATARDRPSGRNPNQRTAPGYSSVCTERPFGTSNSLTESAPPDAGVTLDAKGEAAFKWPVEIVDRSDPLNGQKIRELWLQGSAVTMERWAWHIVPQGAEVRCGPGTESQGWAKRRREQLQTRAHGGARGIQSWAVDGLSGLQT